MKSQLSQWRTSAISPAIQRPNCGNEINQIYRDVCQTMRSCGARFTIIRSRVVRHVARRCQLAYSEGGTRKFSHIYNAYQAKRSSMVLSKTTREDLDARFCCKSLRMKFSVTIAPAVSETVSNRKTESCGFLVAC